MYYLLLFFIRYGVAQGFVLGRLLFLLFINDLPNSSSILKCIIFADDSTLSTSFAEENAMKFTLTLNHELNNVNNWLTFNRICINSENKNIIIFSYITTYMIFSYRNRLHLTNINIWAETVMETNNIIFFEIIFDKHLTFKNNMGVIARKIS